MPFTDTNRRSARWSDDWRKWIAVAALSTLVFSALIWLVPRPPGFVLATIGAIIVGWLITRVMDTLYARIRRKTPLAISVATSEISYVHASSTPQSFVLEEAPEAVPPAPPEWEANRSPWAYDLGAIDANSTEVQVIIEAHEADAVIIDGFKVNVLRRERPASGTYLQQLGGDLVDVRYIGIDLDQTPPRLTFGLGYTEGKGHWNFPLVVSGESPEVLHLFARTSKYLCSWIAELRYTFKGSRHIAIINDNGSPFRTTSTQNAKKYVLLADGSLTSWENVLPQ